MEAFRVMANGNHGWPKAERRIFQIQLHKRPEASARLELAILILVNVRVRKICSEQVLGAGLVYILEKVQCALCVEVEENITDDNQVNRPERLQRQVEAHELDAIGLVKLTVERVYKKLHDVGSDVMYAGHPRILEDVSEIVEVAAWDIDDCLDLEQLDEMRHRRADSERRRERRPSAAAEVLMITCCSIDPRI
jgi:hypothetical protein